MKYLIINQVTGQKLSGTIKEIAQYLDATPAMIKLHIDKECQLNGFEIKTLK